MHRRTFLSSVLGLPALGFGKNPSDFTERTLREPIRSASYQTAIGARNVTVNLEFKDGSRLKGVYYSPGA